jgi:hypothetical protein
VYQISEALAISRQAVYDIRKGKYCPSLTLIHRMCEAWDCKFELGGIVIDRATLTRDKQASMPKIEKQGSLFETFGQLNPHQFEVIATKPMGRALEITLRLTIPEEKTGTTSA